MLSTNVTRATANWVDTDTHGRLYGNKVILCIPPLYASRLLGKPSGFDTFAKATKYSPYWSVTFFGAEWDNTKGQKKTPYGIVAIAYPFRDRGRTVVSAAATRFDVPNASGVALKDLNDKDAAEEIRRQLGFDDTIEYAFLHGKYNDQSFLMTPTHQIHNGRVDGVHVVGTLNGHSSYHFTSMESAIQNALVFAGTHRSVAWYISDAIVGALLGLVLWFV